MQFNQFFIFQQGNVYAGSGGIDDKFFVHITTALGTLICKRLIACIAPHCCSNLLERD
jgi:hypothetical protein